MIKEVEDADDWMQVTDEDLERWSQGKGKGKRIDVEEVVRAVNAFGEGESGLDGIATSAAAADEPDVGDSDDDELLFDPDKFDSLFVQREHVVRPDFDEDVDSDSDFDEMMAENLPGFRGDAAQAGGEEGDHMDEVQALANLLASLEGQEGRMGPAAGLLAHLGIPFVPGDDGSFDARPKLFSVVRSPANPKAALDETWPMQTVRLGHVNAPWPVGLARPVYEQ
ncbi:hypothetical protein BCR44DRAFT_51783 [Catenaria anguillulae PL171]|uniref:Uncharacterized protein n=1 Tax=Catenaria anguillulae PL171 TaxID=765915 RepID=A0A1Y2HAF5_9FUNG|nr:hypothetical protein BCR44DRAFT_51783 [Catenaria anguillulae PL171]